MKGQAQKDKAGFRHFAMFSKKLSIIELSLLLRAQLCLGRWPAEGKINNRTPAKEEAVCFEHGGSRRRDILESS